jgi:hypothetical protein
MFVIAVASQILESKSPDRFGLLNLYKSHFALDGLGQHHTVKSSAKFFTGYLDPCELDICMTM